MSSTRGSNRNTTDLGFQLDDLSDEVLALRNEIAALRSELAVEVRTARVVLVEPDGFERGVLAAQGAYGRLALNGRTGSGEPTCVELFVNDPLDGDAANVGVALTDQGDVVSVYELFGGQGARFSLELPDPLELS